MFSLLFNTSIINPIKFNFLYINKKYLHYILVKFFLKTYSRYIKKLKIINFLIKF